MTGCGGGSNKSSVKTCETDSDCSVSLCEKCISNECVKNKRPNCCGNKQCDEGENECNCEKDCDACESDYEFYAAKCEDAPLGVNECSDGMDNDNDKLNDSLDPSCNQQGLDQKECIIELNFNSLQRESRDFQKTISTNVLSFTPSFDSPFVLGHSKLNINIKADKLVDNTKIKITRIVVYDEKSSSNRVQLAEHNINQILYTINSEIDEDFILTEDGRNNTNTITILEDEKDLSVEIYYDRLTIDSSGEERSSISSFDKDIKDDLLFVIMPNSTCDVEDCMDDNACTIDSCKNINGYLYCVNEYALGNCCGNKQCDANEDKCNCPGDCGDCEFSYGDYIHYSCDSSNKCSPDINDDELEEKANTFDASISDLGKFKMEVYFNQPFALDKSFEVKITPQIIDEDAISPVLQSIELTESGTQLLGKLELNEALMGVGETKSYSVKPSLLSMSDPERELRPKIEVNFKFEKNIGTEAEPRIKPYLRTESLSVDKVYFVDI